MTRFDQALRLAILATGVAVAGALIRLALATTYYKHAQANSILLHAGIIEPIEADDE